MAGANGNPFDMFDGVFGGPSKPPPVKTEYGVAWEAKEINGELYLPIKQVVQVLETNDVLPNVRAALKRHIKE